MIGCARDQRIVLPYNANSKPNTNDYELLFYMTDLHNNILFVNICTVMHFMLACTHTHY